MQSSAQRPVNKPYFSGGFGDPGRTAPIGKNCCEIKEAHRGTHRVSEPLRCNGLDQPPGHKKKRKRFPLSELIKPAHKRFSRVVGYVLTQGNSDAWLGLATVAKARLTPGERVSLAYAALRSLDTPEQAEMVAESVLTFADYPLPTFLNPMEDAQHWASHASLKERKAYALAAYEALPEREQMAFRRHISEVEIAL